MRIDELWSTNGFFRASKGSSAPDGIVSKITVPSERTSWESAAMAELASRIGLHLTDLPLPIFEHLFIFDQLDEQALPVQGDKPRTLRIVVGYEQAWLASVLGERKAALLALHKLRDNGEKEAGILYVSEGEDESILVITGTSPQMTLLSARALVSGEYRQDAIEQAGFGHQRAILIAPKPAAPLTAEKTATIPGNNRSRTFSLHELFTTEGLYEQNDGELLPTLDVLLSMPDGSLEKTVAAVELGARLALSAGYVRTPVTRCAGEENEAGRFEIVFETKTAPAAHGESRMELSEDGKQLRIESDALHLVGFVRELLADGFAPLSAGQHFGWRQRLFALKSDSQDLSLRASLGLQTFSLRERTEIARLEVPEHLARPTEVWEQYVGGGGRAGGPVPLAVTEELPVWTAEWSDPGELAEMEDYLLAVVQKHAEHSGGAALEIEVTTTASEQTFAAWAKKLAGQCRERYGVEVWFAFRDANKSGLNWAMQEVLPQIVQLKDVHSVELRARAFRPADKHFDLVHRFLQELYPFDAILADSLSLPLERIRLQLAEDSAAPMFSVCAFAESKEVLADWSWEGWAESRPYMPDQPQRGRVLVPFAGVRVKEAQTQNELARKPFATNPYRFWQWYQEQVLPMIFRQVGGNPGVPKFSRLECHVGMDAVEKKLPHLEENSSVLEALHEDIYFYTLHAMHNHGKKVGDPEWDAPGGIVPFMHVEQGGKPWARIALYAFPTEHAITAVDASGAATVIRPFAGMPFRDAVATGLCRKETDWSVTLEGIADATLREQCQAWLGFSMAQSQAQPADQQPIAQQATTEASKGKSLWEDVFTGEDVEQWLAQHREQVPGQVVPLDFSLSGRWIWAVELFARKAQHSFATSTAKHALYRPTFFINARHHANEVSSTNAALQMIAQLADDPSVLEAVNLVIIPLENVDGAALHAQLAQDNPCWKHHAARYNACGLEFAKYRFQSGVPFGESRIYPKVWERWAPDIVLDDHGIPSHEWIQPFSGYNSPPRFPVSYWIPSARMYTIWRALTEATPEQREAYTSLRAALTASLHQDAAVAQDNVDWLATYRRWGHDFDPQHFPIELSNGSIAYTRDSPINRNSHDLIERFPEWVTADLMTEVNDETVYGKELQACRHAHHVVHQAIADWMKNRKVTIEEIREHEADGTIRIGLIRKRPL